MSEHNHSTSRRRASNTSSSSAGRRSGSSGSRDKRYGASTQSKSHSSHSAPRRSAPGNHRHKRKGGPDITQILMYVIGAVILVLCIALVVKGCGKTKDKGKESTEASSESSSALESNSAQVTVDGIDITGMSQSEARTAILKQYDWDMKVTYEDKTASVNNLMEDKVDELLEEIYAGDKKDAFQVNTDVIEAAKAEAALIAGNWNLVAKNGGISGYDKDTGKFTFTEGSNGVVIDQEKLAQAIMDAIEKKDYKAVVKAEVKQVSPDMSASQLKDKYKTISTYTTKTTSNSNRNENIRLACNALNGTIINPGQEFSFNDTTGPRSEAKGYKPATAYLNGEIVQEPGGGVCQVSSTLYNAVIFAGLKSTERKAHSYEPSYVTPGEDAAVSFGGPDFKFVNNSDYPVAIKTSFANQELTISIYGVPILKDGEKIRMESKKTGALDPPAPTYEEDQTLQLDEEKVAKEGVPGSSWSTYLVKYKDGEEVSREFFHNSSYRGKAAIIKRNTSGIVLTTEASTEAVLEPSTDAESQPGGQGPAGPGAEQTQPQTQPQQTVPVSPENPGGGPSQQPGGQPDTGNIPNVPSVPGGDANQAGAEPVIPPTENPVVSPGPGSM